MSFEENMRVVLATAEAYNARDWDRLVELLAESVIFTSSTFPKPQKGISAWRPGGAVRQNIDSSLIEAPDAQVEKVRTFGQGDWICVEYIMKGTNTGPLKLPDGRELPATNKPYQLPCCGVFKVEGGKITEWHIYADNLIWLRQLGIE